MLNGYRPWLWLTLLCAALYLPGIAALPALDRDESRFMQASRQMIESGDLIRIRFHDVARNKKPAGIHWLQAASTVVLSDAASTARWPYRLPSALGALAAVLFTFALGLLFLDRRTAFLGAALLASCLLLVGEAHIAKTDAFLLATVAAAQYALARTYFLARDGADPGWPTALLFWAALGVGILIKGPIAPLVAVLTVAGLWIVEKRERLLVRLRWWAGVPLMLAIAAPWFVAMIIADASFIEQSAGRDFLGKLISGQEAHGAPPGFYAVLVWATFAPASLFLGPALVWAWRRRREAPVRFCLLWALPFWLILEIVPTKLPHYILPAYPALALIVAQAVAAAEGGGVRLMRWWLTRVGYIAWYVLAVGFAVAAFVLPIAFGDGVVWGVAISVVAAVTLGAWALWRVWRLEPRGALSVGVVAAIFVFVPVFWWGLPGTSSLWPSRAAGQLFARHSHSGDTFVATTGYREPSLVFELGRRLRMAEPDALVAALQGRSNWLALVADDKKDAFVSGARAAGVSAIPLGVVTGYNYSRGRFERLTLYGPGRRNGR